MYNTQARLDIIIRLKHVDSILNLTVLYMSTLRRINILPTKGILLQKEYYVWRLVKWSLYLEWS